MEITLSTVDRQIAELQNKLQRLQTTRETILELAGSSASNLNTPSRRGRPAAKSEAADKAIEAANGDHPEGWTPMQDKPSQPVKEIQFSTGTVKDRVSKVLSTAGQPLYSRDIIRQLPDVKAGTVYTTLSAMKGSKDVEQLDDRRYKLA